MVEIKKKLKYEYPKVTLFKVWIHFYKNDEKSRVISMDENADADAVLASTSA